MSRHIKPDRVHQRSADFAGLGSERDRLLDAAEVASFLGVHPKTVYRLMRSDRLPCVRVGTRVRFLASDVLRWVSARKE